MKVHHIINTRQVLNITVTFNVHISSTRWQVVISSSFRQVQFSSSTWDVQISSANSRVQVGSTVGKCRFVVLQSTINITTGEA